MGEVERHLQGPREGAVGPQERRLLQDLSWEGQADVRQYDMTASRSMLLIVEPSV